jgi:hypothetical protein
LGRQKSTECLMVKARVLIQILIQTTQLKTWVGMDT